MVLGYLVFGDLVLGYCTWQFTYPAEPGTCPAGPELARREMELAQQGLELCWQGLELCLRLRTCLAGLGTCPVRPETCPAIGCHKVQLGNSLLQEQFHVFSFPGLQALPGGHCATSPLSAELGPKSKNESSAPACFRSASVPRGLLATSRFRILGSLWAASGPRLHSESSSTIPRPRLCVSNSLPFRFRSTSVLLPLCS